MDTPLFNFLPSNILATPKTTCDVQTGGNDDCFPGEEAVPAFLSPTREC